MTLLSFIYRILRWLALHNRSVKALKNARKYLVINYLEAIDHHCHVGINIFKILSRTVLILSQKRHSYREIIQ